MPDDRNDDETRKNRRAKTTYLHNSPAVPSQSAIWTASPSFANNTVPDTDVCSRSKVCRLAENESSEATCVTCICHANHLLARRLRWTPGMFFIKATVSRQVDVGMIGSSSQLRRPGLSDMHALYSPLVVSTGVHRYDPRSQHRLSRI